MEKEVLYKKNSSKKVNWNLYRCFVAVYEAGSYSRAVDWIDVARNNIKANVDVLSRQLGEKLFISNPHGVKATTYSVRIYPTIKQVVTMLLNIERNEDICTEPKTDQDYIQRFEYKLDELEHWVKQTRRLKNKKLVL